MRTWNRWLITPRPRLEEALAEEGSEPDERTKDLAAFLRIKQVARPPNSGANMSLHQQFQGTTHTTLLSTTSPYPLPSSNVPALFTQQSILNASPMAFAQMLPLELSSEDIAIWFGIRSAHIVCLVQQWRKQALFCDILQAVT